MLRLTAAGLLGLGLLTAGCGTEGGDDETDTPTPTTASTPTPTAVPTPTPTAAPTPTPTAEPASTVINIVSPRGGPVPVGLGSDVNMTVPVTTTITPPGFVLKAPGTCETADGDNCGHIYLQLDGDAGNADGMAYNTLSTTLLMEAHFAELATPTGEHTLSVSLRNDDGTQFMSKGEAVVDEITVTAEGAEPSLEIVAPETGDIVQPANNAALSLAVTVQAIDLVLENIPEEGADPCDGEPRCGLLYLYIDGTDGNYNGNAYNSVSAGAGLVANFAALGDPTGEHVITVEYKDRAGNIINDLDGNPLTDSVTVDVVLPNPALIPENPEDGGTVRAGPDAENTTNFTFTTEDFRVGSEQVCSNITAACGQVWANVDGDSCNRTTFDFNAISEQQGAIGVKFGLCNTVYGEHDVLLSLHNSDGSAVMSRDGNPVEQLLTVFVIATNDVTVTIVNPQNNADVTPNGDGDMNVVYAVAGGIQIGDLPGTGTEETECTDEAGDPPCGFVKAAIDGGTPVNSTNGNAIALDVSGLANGEHTLTLEVWEHGGAAPVTAQGRNVSDSATFYIGAGETRR